MRLVQCDARLLEAAQDMRYLLDRGYTRKVSLSIVTDRYSLDRDERMMLFRGVYGENIARIHLRKMISSEELAGRKVGVDFYNALITVESGLTRKLLVMGDDGFLRDIRGLHGKYHRRRSSLKAVDVVIKALKQLDVAGASFLLDSMISKSGEMRAAVEEAMRRHGLSGEASTTKSPDREVASLDVSMSSDSVVIEAASTAFDLPSFIFLDDVRVVAYTLK
jgi:hypothetical protein